jgi:hypothetical protein
MGNNDTETEASTRPTDLKKELCMRLSSAVGFMQLKWKKAFGKFALQPHFMAAHPPPSHLPRGAAAPLKHY